MSKTSLNELLAVIAIARRGNFRQAAVDMKLSSSALSHSIAGLEAQLGVRLFNRTTRKVSLSAAGRTFVERVTPALHEIQGAMAGARAHSDTPTGQLRLSASMGGARQVLTPIVLAYLRLNPEMSIDVVTGGRPADLEAERFDAALHPGPAPRDMASLPIGPDQRSIVVGSPNYLSGLPRPELPGDILAHRCIRARTIGGAVQRWTFEQWGETLTVEAPGRLTLDDGALIRDAAMAGGGLAFLPAWMVLGDIAAGRLVQVLADWTPAHAGLTLYWPERRTLPASLKAFIALAQTARAMPDGPASPTPPVRTAPVVKDGKALLGNLTRRPS